jgi:hypothetical protein
MPQKTVPSRKSSSGRSKASQKSSWLQQRTISLYRKPALFVLAFMVVGGLSLVWASAATTTYGLWDNSAVPKVITATDRHNLELGMKFKSKVSGYVTGVKFYKSAQNTGTHTGSLWTERGRLLATATFQNETRSGWQTVQFDKPVSVAADVTYVVSYHAPKGRYSVDFKYFNKKNIERNNLVGQKATQRSANGVYKYSNSTRFPSEDGSGANYWVDVLFTNKLFNAPTGPAAPGNISASAIDSKTVVLTWATSSSAWPIVKYEVYRDGAKIGEATGTTYTDNTAQAGKKYYYKVKAMDNTSATSAFSTEVSVTTPTPNNPNPAPTPNPTPNPTPTPTPTPTPGANTTDLTHPSKKEIAMRLVSSAENSSLNWKAQYAYLEDIGDGRGYTGGIIGFCSGTGDMLELIEHYTGMQPDNPLAKYLPALRKVNGTDSHAGLGAPFEADWKLAASDPKFLQAQDYLRDLMYFNPAVNQAMQDGLKTLGQFIYYDAIVMHGPGSDPVSFGGIRATAMKKAKTPAQGGNETTYLNAFLDARVAAMKTEAAHDDTSRVDTAQRVFLQQGNLYLNPPLNWHVYGDPFSIPTLP